jgi:FixJ family two-component response regulator
MHTVQASDPAGDHAGVLVHIVDDDASLRSALSRLLSAAGYQVASHDCAASFLQADTVDRPGCILLDVNMPGLSGLQLQAHLATVHNPLPVIFLTGEGDIAMSVKAIKAGAEDFLSKPVASADLFDAIERAVQRYHQAFRQHGELRDMAARVASLTPREHEVFLLVVLGLLNKQIAYQLGNTERTVKAHRHAVMEKMQVDSLAELVQVASRLDLLKQDAPIAA